ncbi:MAG: hypothetical protein HIU83_12330 [Proteobacteria bacterium]|nr:hypothetical protein [Pseudomonadota bacterium]
MSNPFEERESGTYRQIVQKRVDDLSYLIGATTWTLEEGLNLLATFKTPESHNEKNIDDSEFIKQWRVCYEIFINMLDASELQENTFLTYCEYARNSQGEIMGVILHKSTICPIQFIDWAKDISISVPDDFYNKTLKAHKARGGKKLQQQEFLDEMTAPNAAEKRELGRLRREKESFDLAIKATVKAVRFCISENRRVKREELFDLLTKEPNGISKELFERILPLLPEEFRKGAGAPKKTNDTDDIDE